jgi:hypothetical protein
MHIKHIEAVPQGEHRVLSLRRPIGGCCIGEQQLLIVRIIRSKYRMFHSETTRFHGESKQAGRFEV